MEPKAHTTKDAMASQICVLYSEHKENTHIYLLPLNKQFFNLLGNIFFLYYRDIAAEEEFIVP